MTEINSPTTKEAEVNTYLYKYKIVEARKRASNKIWNLQKEYLLQHDKYPENIIKIRAVRAELAEFVKQQKEIFRSKKAQSKTKSPKKKKAEDGASLHKDAIAEARKKASNEIWNLQKEYLLQHDKYPENIVKIRAIRAELAEFIKQQKELLLSKKVRSFWKQLWYDYAGILYMLPVIIGIVGFTIVPMLTSLNYAFHDYDPYARDPAEQLLRFGFQHFETIFTKGENGGTFESVMYALYVTFRYSILNILIGIVGSYMLALFLNQKTKGVKIFRVVYYLPVLIPGVAGTLLWKDITAVKGGYLNMIFEAIGLNAYSFYEAKATVLPTLLFVSLFSLGGSTIMWLAQMKNVPTEMYESADLDGANYFQKLFFITIPMTTSMLFYMLIMSTIGGLQAFGNVYPLIDVAGKEVEFIVVQIYISAYEAGDLSYACALSWFLFVIIGLLTAFVFKTSKWVYYGEEA